MYQVDLVNYWSGSASIFHPPSSLENMCVLSNHMTASQVNTLRLYLTLVLNASCIVSRLLDSNNFWSRISAGVLQSLATWNNGNFFSFKVAALLTSFGEKSTCFTKKPKQPIMSWTSGNILQSIDDHIKSPWIKMLFSMWVPMSWKQTTFFLGGGGRRGWSSLHTGQLATNFAKKGKKGKFQKSKSRCQIIRNK